MKRKIILIVSIVTLVLAGIGGYAFLQLYSSNTSFSEDSRVLLLPQKGTVEDLAEGLKSANIIESKSSFLWSCKIKRFDSFKKPGRYLIEKGASNQEIINMIRIGSQTPVNIRFGAEKSLEELAGTLGSVLMYDSSAFSNAFANAILQNTYGVNADLFPCLFMADTYEEFWTVTPDDFIQRMKKKVDQFWTPENKKLAADLGLSVHEATILASIVKGETGKMDEAPKIAGLYLNRLRINMPLQADPTALFGAGARNVDRVTNEIAVESRYNTYDFVGLPPGPIAFTEKNFLEAVLHPQKHEFLYMCAKPDLSGYHNFSKTYDQHRQFAAEYHRALDEKGIR